MIWTSNLLAIKFMCDQENQHSLEVKNESVISLDNFIRTSGIAKVMIQWCKDSAMGLEVKTNFQYFLNMCLNYLQNCESITVEEELLDSNGTKHVLKRSSCNISLEKAEELKITLDTINNLNNAQTGVSVIKTVGSMACVGLAFIPGLGQVGLGVAAIAITAGGFGINFGLEKVKNS